MLTNKYTGYEGTGLKPFAEMLESKYYNAIEKLCTNARNQSEKIMSIENRGGQQQYVAQCEMIVNEIGRYVNSRKITYIPYVYQLSEKVINNHDCSNCSGSCKLNHDMHIMEINVTNDEMKRVLSKLQMITLPLYSETIFPDEYRLLRSNMTLLETHLTELFFLENSYLIPKIAEAQKTINAGNK